MGTVTEEDKRLKKSKITTWKEKDQDIIVTYDGKIFLVLFDKVFPNKEIISKYNMFHIKKGSYEKQMPVITKYINFFMKFYDSEHEMLLAYLKLKFMIDKERMFNESNYKQLIAAIYDIFFTPSIVEKIKRLVEDNYLDDIESSEGSKKYISKEKKHLESLEFTNQHIKILLRISFGMKCIAPILFHFIAINVIKLEKDSEMIYEFYRPLFDIFSDGVNIYNKLFVYVKAKVLESKSHNTLMFEQRDILGDDEYSVIHQFLHKVLISENVVKYRFNEHWDPKQKKFKENIVGFNKTIIKYQLMYFLKEQYSKTLTEVTYAKNSEGLSGMDKMEMNLQKIDEGAIILAEKNIELSIKKIREENDFDISEEEIDYYVKNHKPKDLQIQLVFSYWGKYFGAYRNTSQINRRQYIILMLILKYKLLLSAGCEKSDEEDSTEYTTLPYMLSGNIQDKTATRIIRNTKFVGKVQESYLYEKLKETKYKNLCMIRPDYIIGLLSQLINSSFTYVVYERQDLLGKEIVYNEDKLSDECLFFLSTM